MSLQCALISASSGEPSVKTFTFDGVYDQTSSTEQIYNDFGYPLVEVRYSLNGVHHVTILDIDYRA